jgi:hypothetical protein
LGASSAGQRRHVERVGDAAVDEVVGHLLGDLQRDVDLRLVGRGAEVRGGDEVRRAEQRVLLGRLGDEHVERGAGDVARIEQLLERRLVDQPAARAVDDAHALLGLGEVLAAEDVARLVGQRRVQRDEVGALEQLSSSTFSTPISTARSGERNGS